MTLQFKQTGDQVVMGVYEKYVNDAPVKSVHEGIVDGNILRFTAPSSGELVMDEKRKSFKGNIKGFAATGTFVRP